MKKYSLLVVIFLFQFMGLYAQKQQTFEIGNKTFLLDGKPFVIKAAEIHYPRIPEPYWEHRIQMCKALGMNTICLYVFWNYHEQEPDQFDFSGDKDIARFCRLAQQQGMYVIVRPGPYVCAEWEMGGLPWWLLKKIDIKLRSLDTYYMNRVEKFMNKVGNHLADLQITRGGNIIMVQVENEYGAYAADKPYITAIRDIVKKAGFTDVPLFQCDWNSNFRQNGLDDLLWTINFGTGANIETQFKELKQLRPDSPLMCSEFWSGWFDHWGRKHETRDAKAMVEGMKDMLDRNISFSLYMAHGGTTFGHWGGANNPAYSAMCSSYDYDAPISEAGWTTDKFVELRNMLAGYQKNGTQLSPVPASFPIIEIPEIRFKEVAPLFDNLPKAQLSEVVKPMEQFNQGWGSILYRMNLPQVENGTLLRITELHDWGQVFVDGKLIACLDRRKGENEVMLPSLKAGSQLDILIEAMGRVNFDKSIHDRKGITEKVELVANNISTVLTKWQVYSLPIDYSFVNSRRYKKETKRNSPAYYRTTFHLNEVGDTFMDMQSWGKGMVWVNGHALGRFWEIGPQQTLFMPGCWLKKGANEIIILDLKVPRNACVRGVKAPVLDMLCEQTSFKHRKGEEAIRLKNEKIAGQGHFKPGNSWQEVLLTNKTSGRYFCLEALNAQNGKEVAAIAELEVLGVDRQPISREFWKILYADSEEVNNGNRTADKIFDLQESTFWMTDPKDVYPHQILIDLGKENQVTGFRYLPRSEQGYPGMINEYRLYIKSSPFLIK